MRPKNFNVHDLISNLNGSCNTINEELPYGMDEEDLTEEDRAVINETIFECDTCGWWYDIEEMNESEGGENICSDCKNSE
jgi:hypothetical protein